MVCYALGFIAGDVVTGIASSLYKGEFNSTIMREGMWHKLGSILAILACIFIQHFVRLMGVEMGFNISDACAIYICVMEIGSIMENVCSLNPTLTKVMSRFLKKLKSSFGGDVDE